MSEKCPVCSSDVLAPKTFNLSTRDIQGYCYSCPMCGDYGIENLTSGRLPAILVNDQKRALLSHWIRTKYESIRDNERRSESIILDNNLVDSILSRSPPSVAEQADSFVLWLGNSNPFPGEPVSVRPATHQAIMGAMTRRGFTFILRGLMERGLLNPTTISVDDGQASVTLSFEGWQHYEKLRRGTSDSRRAFMAMQYGNKQLADVVENVFKDAVAKTGFDLRRLVDTPQPAGLIDDDLRVKIRASRFLIADLTDGNAGAYWEAGYAEGLGKPVIYTCKKQVFEDPKSCPHFDTNHHLTILWDSDKPQGAGEKLKNTIRATLPAEAKLTDD